MKRPAAKPIPLSPRIKKQVVDFANESKKHGYDYLKSVQNQMRDHRPLHISQFSRICGEAATMQMERPLKDCSLSKYIDLKKYNEGFYLCVVYRQILEMRKRPDYDRSAENQWRIQSLMQYQPFTGFKSSINIGELFELHDWENPIPLNSPWLIRRRALVEAIGEHLKTAVGVEEGEFLTFVFAFVLHNTGSDALVTELEKDKSHVVVKGLRAPAFMLHQYFEKVQYAIFHARFRPMLKRWQRQRLAHTLAAGGAHLWRRPLSHADESDEEEPDEGPVAPLALIAVKYLEMLPLMKDLRVTWEKIRGGEDIWVACSRLSGFKGEGFNLKNFALLYFTPEQLDGFSSGGSGPKRSYNISHGQNRLAPMTEASLSLLCQKDVIAFNSTYWNGRFFGGKVFNQLLAHERRIGAVVVIANRCAYDKVTSKVVFKLSAPAGHDSWRAYAKARRAAST